MSYTTISLPSPMAQEIDKAISDEIHGYSSRTEFVKDAIRRRLETLGSKKIQEVVPAE